MKECAICNRPNSEEHHRIYRSECKPLVKCKKNLVYLCAEHHRGSQGVHGKHGDKLNRKLKIEFQEWLQGEFKKDKYTMEEIQKKLDVSSNAVRSLSKLMRLDKGAYLREDIIRVCMGGKMYDTSN
ncbi:hypothetical protein KQI86_19520 [Clostridium sp. MSJ-11]|uniref:Phage protein n=1 Tax=Clostridium mobile TaxID=2841512 RepID=A0ABS6EMN2_9CLOT|nr:hypothetical protein [Clostridium mobile]MBU5486494.1 hypothetical protein [Clostridium mobile]